MLQTDPGRVHHPASRDVGAEVLMKGQCVGGAGLLRASVSLSARLGRGTRYPEPPPTLLGMETPRMLSTPTQHQPLHSPSPKITNPKKASSVFPQYSILLGQSLSNSIPPGRIGPCLHPRVCVCVCGHGSASIADCSRLPVPR